MAYDPTTLEAQKGKLGEEIVRRFYEQRGAAVCRPDGIEDNDASLIDFHIEPSSDGTVEEHLAEVKVRNVMSYAFGRYLCYTIPVSQAEMYKQYANDRNLPVFLWIVDPKAGKMYCGELAPWGLEATVSVDGKDFPFDQQTKCGNMRFYHRRQFVEFSLDTRDIIKFEELQASFEPNFIVSDAPQTEKPLDSNAFTRQQNLFIAPERHAQKTNFSSARVVKSLKAPNGTKLDLLAVDGSDDVWVTGRQVSLAVGFATNGEDFTREKNPNAQQVLCPVTSGINRGVRIMLCDCLRIADALATIETYMKKTYGARQGTKKYNRHMEATRLAVWWKNVVLEE